MRSTIGEVDPTAPPGYLQQRWSSIIGCERTAAEVADAGQRALGTTAASSPGAKLSAAAVAVMAMVAVDEIERRVTRERSMAIATGAERPELVDRDLSVCRLGGGTYDRESDLPSIGRLARLAGSCPLS